MARITLRAPASGTGTFTVTTPAGNIDRTFTLPDMTGGLLTDVLMPQVTASGLAIDFTGIPTAVSRLTLMLDGISLSGTSNLLVQLGGSGGFENSGYSGASALAGTAVDGGAALFSSGFVIRAGAAAAITTGALTFTRMLGNKWIMSGGYSRTDSPFSGVAAGVKTLSAELDRLRLTTVNGTDTFDAGAAALMYEG